MQRAILYAGYAVFFALLGTAVLDYTVFVYHQRHGAAYGFVTVRQFLESPLKGNKAEYDYLGPVDKPCARAVLPHQETPPCWWLRAHKDRWTKP